MKFNADVSRILSQKHFDAHFQWVHSFLGSQKHDSLSKMTAASKPPTAIESNAMVRMLCGRREIGRTQILLHPY